MTSRLLQIRQAAQALEHFCEPIGQLYKRQSKPLLVLVMIRKGAAIRHALNVLRMSADITSMDGLESGGHPGEEAVDN